MPALTNHRHEQFAQRIASGASATVAYGVVYQVANKSAAAHGCRLIRNGKVSARIAELQRAAATSAVVSLQEKREFLALIVLTPIGKVDERSPLCQYFRRTAGRRASLHIRMPDKLQAIMLDARLAGELRGDSLTVNATAVSGIVIPPERIAELMRLRRLAIEGEIRASKKLEQPRTPALTNGA